MIADIFEWIVVGGANHIMMAAPELTDQGGVTPDEAFKLLTTEWGRHARYHAQEIVRAWDGHTNPTVKGLIKLVQSRCYPGELYNERQITK